MTRPFLRLLGVYRRSRTRNHRRRRQPTRPLRNIWRETGFFSPSEQLAGCGLGSDAIGTDSPGFGELDLQRIERPTPGARSRRAMPTQRPTQGMLRSRNPCGLPSRPVRGQSGCRAPGLTRITAGKRSSPPTSPRCWTGSSANRYPPQRSRTSFSYGPASARSPRNWTARLQLRERSAESARFSTTPLSTRWRPNFSPTTP